MGNKATGIAAPRACLCNDLLADAGSCRAVPNVGKVTHEGEKYSNDVTTWSLTISECFT